MALGTAATTAATDYATAAQGTTADAAVPKSLVDAKGDLLVGTADNTVNPLNSTAYRDTLMSKGLKVKTVIVQGGGHSPSTARLDTLRTWLNAEGFLTPTAILPHHAKSLKAGTLFAGENGDLDALGRFSNLPYGPILQVVPGVKKP